MTTPGLKFPRYVIKSEDYIFIIKYYVYFIHLQCDSRTFKMFWENLRGSRQFKNVTINKYTRLITPSPCMITAIDSFQWQNCIRRDFFLIYAQEGIIFIVANQKRIK